MENSVNKKTNKEKEKLKKCSDSSGIQTYDLQEEDNYHWCLIPIHQKLVFIFCGNGKNKKETET